MAFPLLEPAVQIRCPHCHQPMELVDDDPSGDVTCESCGSGFNLADGEPVVDGGSLPPCVPKWIRSLADEICELAKQVDFEPFRKAVVEWVHEKAVLNDLEKRHRDWVEKEVKAGRTVTASDEEERQKNGEPAPEGRMLVGVSDGEKEHRYVWVPKSPVIEPDPDADLIEKTLDIAQSPFSDRQLSRIERLTLISAIHDRCQSGAEEINPWSFEDPISEELNPIGGARYFSLVYGIGNLTPQPDDELAPDEELARFLRNTLDLVRKDLEVNTGDDVTHPDVTGTEGTPNSGQTIPNPANPERPEVDDSTAEHQVKTNAAAAMNTAASESAEADKVFRGARRRLAVSKLLDSENSLEWVQSAVDCWVERGGKPVWAEISRAIGGKPGARTIGSSPHFAKHPNFEKAKRAMLSSDGTVTASD
jgi:hypothetical protein